MANINELTPREFEVLAANYARSIFPDYNWKITKAVGDYNRDFEAVVDDLSKWGEAKQTEEDSTAVSKGRWDPTLLSAILKNDVDELIYNVPLVKTQMKKIIVTAKTLYSHPKNVSKIYAALHTDLAW